MGARLERMTAEQKSVHEESAGEMLKQVDGAVGE